MWKVVFILCVLALPGAAYAQDGPSAQDWETWGPERCATDPGDPLKLTPLIFPSVFKTVPIQFDTPYKATEIIIYPGGVGRDGKTRSPVMTERVIPNMRHRQYIRIFDHQYLAFLDANDQLVDENGKAITPDNPARRLERTPPTKTEVLWERRTEQKDTGFAALENLAQTCAYHAESPIYEQRLQRLRDHHYGGGVICKDRGGYTLAPINIHESLKTKTVKVRSGRVTLWDHKGRKYSGAAEALAKRFNKLAETGKCQWSKAKVD